MIEQTELKYWLALHATVGIGAVSFLKIRQCMGSLQDVFDRPEYTALQCGLSTKVRKALQKPDWQRVDKTLEWLENDYNHLICLEDIEYPPLLKEISNPPPLLFLHGNRTSLLAPQLGVVGSRNPSHSGRALATDFADQLSQQGLTITSGLALGIDACAHQGVLKNGGKTVAVVGTGLDRVYPAEHHGLAHRIAEEGALVSEFPLGSGPLASHFPQRNRIISGMSLGVLVVEAAVKSGSLITARLGMEQGREIFAIPGALANPLSRGCHALIRQGAKLVESVEDIVEELMPLVGALSADLVKQVDQIDQIDQVEEVEEVEKGSLDSLGDSEVSAEGEVLLNCLAKQPLSVDELVTNSGLTTENVSSSLLMLEIEGRICAVGGGRYRLVY
jgi:DNA processing protein